MRRSGVRGTSSPLIGFEQTVGIDLPLERRPECEPCRLGRLARVVGRVESVCTDPPAKGPTGPFCLVHLVMLPIAFRRHPPRSWLGGVEVALLPCWVSRVLAPIAEPLFWSSLHLLLSRAWGRVQEAERERSDRAPSSAGCKTLCTISCGCLTVRFIALISCTNYLARQAEPE